MIRVIVFQVILLLFQALLYFGVQKFEGPAHDVSCRLDKKIPYLPCSIFVYVLWFPMIFLFPLCVYQHTFAIYKVYIMSIIADIVISIAVYLIYPSTFERPEAPEGCMGRIMRFVYRCDYKGKNCMPSMHCSMCFIIFFISTACAEYNPHLYAGFKLLSMFIVISTLLTKQHVIIDVVAGFLTAVAAAGLGALLAG